MGIEPTQLAWKARTLPLSYTRKRTNRTQEYHIKKNLSNKKTKINCIMQENIKDFKLLNLKSLHIITIKPKSF